LAIEGAQIAEARARPFGIDLSIAVFDRATRIAKTLFSGSEALIVLMQDGVTWRSRGYDAQYGARDAAGELVLKTGEFLWIEDATLDERFCDEPSVAGPPYLRSYAAAPIRLEDGTTPGVLCVVGLAPLPYDRTKAARLKDLADFVADEWTRARTAHAHAEAAQALTTAQTTLSAIAETIPISLVMTDLSLRVIAASRVWREDLGLVDQPVQGRSLFELSPVYEPFEADIRRAASGEPLNAAQVPITRADGSRVWMQVDVKSWSNAQGERAGLVITASDVTELRAALEVAERSQDRLNLALELSKVHVWELDYVNRKLFKAGAEDTFSNARRPTKTSTRTSSSPSMSGTTRWSGRPGDATSKRVSPTARNIGLLAQTERKSGLRASSASSPTAPAARSAWSARSATSPPPRPPSSAM
jgi:PAS domain S-box-containing protein